MEILYQDRDLVVVVKPRGLLSEEGDPQSVPAQLLPLVGKVWTVHRLDRAVGGVMVYARTQGAAAALSAAMQAGALQKTYTAVVTGVPDAPEAVLRDYLYHDRRQNKTFVVDRARAGAKEAILSYRLLAQKSENGVEFSELSVKLQTGRSHQIRVQLGSRQLPLCGDGKYGSRVKAPFPALYATELRFPHPRDGREMSFSAPVPGDFPWSLFGESHYEIERKFLIAYPDTAALTAAADRILQIEQTYLQAATGETRRVRRVEMAERVQYIYTCKRRVSDLRAVEEERPLTAAEYEALLGEADPARRPIRKTRYCVPCGAHTAEIDLYNFWQDRATLEVELATEAEAFTLPPFVTVLRDVTADKRYKNVNLARELPD
ncbi:MAG: hypothetical protein E7590_07245 [Ruminococcaceae bacterium]|nr:hypothetical protein [Oscillospiraceae bacterium]